MTRHGYKLDLGKVEKLKAHGLSNAVIAARLGVTHGAIYHALRRLNKNKTAQCSPSRSS